MAEYFRDQEGQDVLLFIDNIFRFTQANSEVSALLGRIPSAVGYQPTLSTDLGMLQERITTTTKGSITSVQVRVCFNALLLHCLAFTISHVFAITAQHPEICDFRHAGDAHPHSADRPGAMHAPAGANMLVDQSMCVTCPAFTACAKNQQWRC